MLIKCKECGNQMSIKAEACPKCGSRTSDLSKPLKVALNWISYITALFGLSLIMTGLDYEKATITLFPVMCGVVVFVSACALWWKGRSS